MFTGVHGRFRLRGFPASCSVLSVRIRHGFPWMMFEWCQPPGWAIDRGESNSFPPVHGCTRACADTLFSPLCEVSEIVTAHGCPPAQMSEMVSTGFSWFTSSLHTSGLEYRVGLSIAARHCLPTQYVSRLEDCVRSPLSAVVHRGGCHCGCQTCASPRRTVPLEPPVLSWPFAAEEFNGLCDA